jgi:tetratricopeptide (TPR) repeat protein
MLAAKRLFDAVDQYLRDSSKDTDASRKLKCCLLAAEAALTGPPVDLTIAERFLSRGASLVPQVSARSSIAAEFHYRALQMAGKTGNDAARREHADWLVQNAAGSAYEVPALIVAANAIDQAVAAAGETQKPQLHDEATAIYRRLVERLGDSPEDIAAKKNVRVAISKLAGYEYSVGRYAAAAELLERLLAVYPASEEYLRRAAIAHFEAGEPGDSLPHWRSLLAGVARNSDGWYEAKYYQIRCLLGTEPEAGRRVLEQFQLLHPELGPDTWRDKFRELIDDGA